MSAGNDHISFSRSIGRPQSLIAPAAILLRPFAFFLALAAFLLAPAARDAHAATLQPGVRGGASWCGTDVSSLTVSAARHRSFQRRLDREGIRARRQAGDGRAASVAAGPQITQRGRTVIIEDDGTLIAEPNPFDLANRAIQFERRGAKLRGRPSGAGFNADLGSRLDLGDDDSVLVELPFTFRFFGARYSRVFVNSDGNLTFGEGDSQSTPRSLARALNGPPRIAPFFSDLNPATATGDGGVYVASGGGSVRITWFEMPEFGKSNRNTFQVTLYSGGRVVFRFLDLDANEAIVGVSPGGIAPLELLDLSEELPTGNSDIALLERFGAQRAVDDFGVAKAFYGAYRDIHDHFILFLDTPVFLDGAFAYELTVSNDVQGIGVPQIDVADLLGSGGRLQAFLQMGYLARYPTNPNETFLGTNTTLDLLGQEAGHRWLAFPRFRKADGSRSSDLLGRDFAHWSFNMDSDASVMEGNDIVDNGDGSFTTVAATSRFSLLDRYFMGLVPPAEVPDFFYVDGAGPAERAPEIGALLRGTRVNVSIDDIIAAEGERVPASAAAPKKFNMVFVLLARQGQPPTPASIDHVNRIRKQWRSYFRLGTGGKAKISTTPKKL